MNLFFLNGEKDLTLTVIHGSSVDIVALLEFMNFVNVSILRTWMFGIDFFCVTRCAIFAQVLVVLVANWTIFVPFFCWIIGFMWEKIACVSTILVILLCKSFRKFFLLIGVITLKWWINQYDLQVLLFAKTIYIQF